MQMSSDESPASLQHVQHLFRQLPGADAAHDLIQSKKQTFIVCVVFQKTFLKKELDKSHKLTRRLCCQAGDDHFNSLRISLCKGGVIGIQAAGMIFTQTGIDEQFGNDMAEKSAIPFLIQTKRLSKQATQFSSCGIETGSAVKPLVIDQMLSHPQRQFAILRQE